MIRVNVWCWESDPEKDSSNKEFFLPPATALHDELMKRFSMNPYVEVISKNRVVLNPQDCAAIHFAEVSPGTEHDMEMLFLATKLYVRATGNCSVSVNEFLKSNAGG